jgi:hypothetical protein
VFESLAVLANEGKIRHCTCYGVLTVPTVEFGTGQNGRLSCQGRRVLGTQRDTVTVTDTTAPGVRRAGTGRSGWAGRLPV